MRVVFVLIFAMLLFACEEEPPVEREGSRGGFHPSERTESFGGFAPGGTRIESARWIGAEISVRGEVEGGGYMIFCSLREGESRSVAEESCRYDVESSGAEVVGDAFVYTFIEGEEGFDPSLEYRVYCALAGGGGEGPNSFSDPFDEVGVTGDPARRAGDVR